MGPDQLVLIFQYCHSNRIISFADFSPFFANIWDENNEVFFSGISELREISESHKEQEERGLSVR